VANQGLRRNALHSQDSSARTEIPGISIWNKIVGSFAVWELHPGNGPSPMIHSLAVLPLESLSSDASQDYFADGMTDELILRPRPDQRVASDFPYSVTG
jgi:hypothetical protein